MFQIEREVQAKALFAALATYATYLVGEADRMLGVLIVLMVLDYVSGVMAAWYTKTLSSSLGLRGTCKKVFVLILVALAHQIDSLTGQAGVVRTAVVWFLAANEGLSITENAAEAGIAIPLLSQALSLLKKKAEADMTPPAGGGPTG